MAVPDLTEAPMHPATDMPLFPANFREQDLPTNGTTLHVRIGGHGAAVVLLHGGMVNLTSHGRIWAESEKARCHYASVWAHVSSRRTSKVVARDTR